MGIKRALYFPRSYPEILPARGHKRPSGAEMLGCRHHRFRHGHMSPEEHFMATRKRFLFAGVATIFGAGFALLGMSE